MRAGAFAYILAVLVLSGPDVSFGCPKQVALSVALDSERVLLAELRSDLQTLPETQQHRRPEIRRRIRETRRRVQELSVLLRKQAAADLAVQVSEDRQIDLGYRAEALVEARAWAIRDFRWEERHSSELRALDPVFYEKLKAKRAEQAVDYALQLLENGTELKTLGQVHLLREAAGDLKSLGGSTDRSLARRLLNRATREEARLTAGRSDLALRIPDDLDVETGWLKSDLLRSSGENSRVRLEAALFGLAAESAKVLGVPSGAVALTGVFRDLHSWSVDGVTVVFRADGRERIRILWVGQGSVDFQLVEQRRRQ